MCVLLQGMGLQPGQTAGLMEEAQRKVQAGNAAIVTSAPWLVDIITAEASRASMHQVGAHDTSFQQCKWNMSMVSMTMMRHRQGATRPASVLAGVLADLKLVHTDKANLCCTSCNSVYFPCRYMRL